jgi:hypothetical protein
MAAIAIITPNSLASLAVKVPTTNRVLVTLLFFFLAGLCEIGGGYFVWLWLRDGTSWIFGVLGGFVLFLYGSAHVPTITLSQDLRGIRRRVYRHVDTLGLAVSGNPA